MCFCIYIFEGGLLGILGVDCILNQSLMMTCEERRKLSSLLTCPSVHALPPAWHQFSNGEVKHWPLKAVFLAWLPELMKCFCLKVLPFLVLSEPQGECLNFREAQSKSLYAARRKLNYVVFTSIGSLIGEKIVFNHCCKPRGDVHEERSLGTRKHIYSSFHCDIRERCITV